LPRSTAALAAEGAAKDEEGLPKVGLLSDRLLLRKLALLLPDDDAEPLEDTEGARAG